MAHEAGKGSRPRPYSVSKEEFDNRFDAIFSKKKKETLAEYELNKSTGEVQQVENIKVDVDLEEYKRQAQDIWNDSCTSPRKK
jgi:hypothetical protein